MTKLLKRRRELSLSQKQLAERAGLKQSQISQMETGRFTPYRVQAQRISEILGLPGDQLLDEV